MIRRSPLLLAFAILFGACQGLTEPQVVQLGEPFWLGAGKVAIIPTSAGALRFDEILEDSRCPSDALILCAWAGRVRLRIVVTGFANHDTAHELRLLDSPNSVTL